MPTAIMIPNSLVRSKHAHLHGIHDTGCDNETDQKLHEIIEQPVDSDQPGKIGLGFPPCQYLDTPAAVELRQSTLSAQH